MMKNAFYFMFRALFVLEIFKFLSSLFYYVEKPPDKKGKVNFKVYDGTGWTITIRIFSYISGSKGNQTMKLGQLIEYNM